MTDTDTAKDRLMKSTTLNSIQIEKILVGNDISEEMLLNVERMFPVDQDTLTDEEALAEIEATVKHLEARMNSIGGRRAGRKATVRLHAVLSRVLELARSAIQYAPVNLDAIIDRDFTGGLSSTDHLRKIRGESDD